MQVRDSAFLYSHKNGFLGVLSSKCVLHYVHECVCTESRVESRTHDSTIWLYLIRISTIIFIIDDNYHVHTKTIKQLLLWLYRINISVSIYLFFLIKLTSAVRRS